MCEAEQLNKNSRMVDPFAISDSEDEEEEDESGEEQREDEQQDTLVSKVSKLNVG